MGGGSKFGGGSFSGGGADTGFGNISCEQCVGDMDCDVGLVAGWVELAVCVSGWCSAGVSNDLGDGGGAGAGTVEKGGGAVQCDRSEERRVGKEWRSRWSPYH